MWEAHQASITTLCAPDYTTEQIAGWASFSYSHEHWVNTMDEDVVLVLELDGRVEGFGHLRVGVNEDPSVAEVVGLYFSPKGAGIGAGRRMLQTLEDVANEQGVTRFVLDSTRTSVGFYEKCGYAKQGEEKAVRTRGVEIQLVPMHKST